VSSLPTLKAEYFSLKMLILRAAQNEIHSSEACCWVFVLSAVREQRTIHASRDETSQRPFEPRASGFSLSENCRGSADEPGTLHDAFWAENNCGECVDERNSCGSIKTEEDLKHQREENGKSLTLPQPPGFRRNWTIRLPVGWILSSFGRFELNFVWL
jgi:hypothetical protein